MSTVHSWSGQTALTQPLSTEQQAIEDERLREHERITVLVHDVLLSAYREGGITLETACSTLHKGVARFDENVRHKALGVFLDQALRTTPPARGRGNKGMPVALRTLAVELVRIAHDTEGRTLQREHSEQTAFERAAEILQPWGFAVTARQVELWWSERTPA